MVKPVHLLHSILKTLRPGGAFACSFSNRMFATKVIEMWMYGDCSDRAKIVSAYFHYAGFGRIEVHSLPPVAGQGDPLNIIVGFKMDGPSWPIGWVKECRN